MTCCAPGLDAEPRQNAFRAGSAEEILLASRKLDGDLYQTDFSVPAAHCGACIAAIEGALGELDGVVSARLNLSTRRATVKWRKLGPVPPFIEALATAGYDASLFSFEDAAADPEAARLLRATAVAGFAAMNIMLLSVSVWAGADAGTRQAFHLVSALIALPAVAFSGRIFFRSAWASLRHGRTNMDVPVSVGILVTLALSLYDTLHDGPHAYFDAVTTLLFFLLVGRTLDHAMRVKARTAVLGLARMMPRGATVVSADGSRTYRPAGEIAPGETVYVVAGERIPFDGTVLRGTADVDAALVSGETAPLSVGPGTAVLSGMLNLDGALEVEVVRGAHNGFLADMTRMMEAAEHARSRYRVIADRAAALYSPVVHALAILAFAGWVLATGDWHHALTIAVSVLIITCPCALGLAVPMVQVVAARRLFQNGVALKDGSALERLAGVDTVVLDKTGTLTSGHLSVIECSLAGQALDVALAMAGRSQHPVSRAIVSLSPSEGLPKLEDFREVAGQGTEARIGTDTYRLGRPEWALGPEAGAMGILSDHGVVLARNGAPLGSVCFAEALRGKAKSAARALLDRGLSIEILSGDRQAQVAAVAASLEIANFHADLLPQDKVARLRALDESGHKVLMVGDGLNDAPALAAAHASIAPGSASDIGRMASDMVLLGDSLDAVPEALDIARGARRLVRENLVLAILYNLCAVPLALTAHVTPLVAALAMSLSSIAVVANALRLFRGHVRLRRGGPLPVLAVAR